MPQKRAQLELEGLEAPPPPAVDRLVAAAWRACRYAELEGACVTCGRASLLVRGQRGAELRCLPCFAEDYNLRAAANARPRRRRPHR
jgi:hypothetical protein